MKIIYVIYNDWSAEQVKLLSSFGIHVREAYDRFDIEKGEIFSKIEPYLKKWKIEFSVGTLYDKKDILESDLLVFDGVWENGYPQPEEVVSYLKMTYNLDKYCHTCGIGAVQNAPFKIKKEPSWGNKKMFTLNWVLDEIFVRKDLYENVMEKMGIQCQPVLIYKKETVSETTVQLKIPVLKNNDLKLSSQKFTTCKECGRKKYHPQIEGFFPGFKKNIDEKMTIFKCAEYFGDQIEAHNKIFIKKDLLETLWEEKIKPNVSAVR